jgi:hypothetical protein
MKEKMTGTIIIVIVSLLSLFLSSCQSSETNKWTPPKFVKEWEIKEIKPGLSHEIISMTANKNGVFVLVKAVETKYSPPKWSKKVVEMTEKEKENFIYQVVMGHVFSGRAASNMTKEEKEKLISFLIDHFIPIRKSSEMTEKEKEVIIDFLSKYTDKFESEINRKLFKGHLRGKGRNKYIDDFSENICKAVREDVEHFRIQHYSFDGNLSEEWPKENRLILSAELRKKIKPPMVPRFHPYKDTKYADSRDYLIKPINIVSDAIGNIYLADYGGNKIVKFDSNGKVLNLWKIERAALLGNHYDDLSHERGLCLVKDKLYVVSEESVGSPRLSEYDLDGRFIREKTIKPPKVYARIPIIDIEIPFYAEEADITDIVADKDGNLYLFARDTVILRLDKEWNESGYIKTILRKGFKKPKPVYDPDRKREIKYEEEISKLTGISLRNFSSEKLSWIENSPGLYYANKIHFSAQEEIYVTFIGTKPFGVIDAMIFNKNGKMISYWKQENRSYSDWYKNLSSDIEVIDIALSAAGNGSSIFLGRTMEVKTGAFYTKNVIQRFDK